MQLCLRDACVDTKFMLLVLVSSFISMPFGRPAKIDKNCQNNQDSKAFIFAKPQCLKC